MEIIGGFLVGLIIGTILVIINRNNHRNVVAKNEELQKELNDLKLEKATLTADIQANKINLEHIKEESVNNLQNVKEQAEANLKQIIAQYEKRIDREKEVANQNEQRLLQEHKHTTDELKQQIKDNLERYKQESENMHKLMNTEFENIAHKILKEHSEDLTKQNNTNVTNLLNPLSENLKAFKQKVEEVYNTESKERHVLGEKIADLVKLNNQISEDANNLTRALKGDSKTQGNWGEMILNTILEQSGLVKGEHYFPQEFLHSDDGVIIKNEETGKKMQPDVIVKFPGNRDMIIDSKVSLTAYCRYAETDDESIKATSLKEHLNSVKSHIDELSVKDYSRYDIKAPDFVMMFIPTEAAYFLAMKHQQNIWEYAYKKKVVLMSPTNLIIALRLALDLWNRENQVKNVQEIINRGNILYEKFVSFTDTYKKIGKGIDDLKTEYDTSFNQLSKGNGNLVRQAEMLRDLKITPKKTIDSKFLDNAIEEN